MNKTTFAVKAIHVLGFITGLCAVLMVAYAVQPSITAITIIIAMCLESLAVNCAVKTVEMERPQ